MRFHTKKSTSKNGFTNPQVRITAWNCMQVLPPLELNWRFQAPKVRGFLRHKFLSFMKCFQIFINVNLSIFKKKKIEAWTPCMYIFKMSFVYLKPLITSFNTCFFWHVNNNCEFTTCKHKFKWLFCIEKKRF